MAEAKMYLCLAGICLLLILIIIFFSLFLPGILPLIATGALIYFVFKLLTRVDSSEDDE